MNIAAEIQKEMDKLAFLAKRKYDRMSPEQQEKMVATIKSMFDYLDPSDDKHE